MRLIGAGLPRTATMSQKVGLEMLGLAPCYHMVTVFADLPVAARWRQALEGERSAAEIVKDFPATVDWPGSYYYRELMDAFPDAKVLLSVRDGDAWARSMRETIWQTLYGDGLVGLMATARRRVDPEWDACSAMLQEMWERSGLMNGAETTDAFMAAACDRYNADVIETVPADRLLVWSPKDGWEPLCEFLELPVPDAPFPRVNDSAAFGEMLIDGAVAAIQQYRAVQATS